MFTGGEAVPEARAARFEDVTGARVLQFYGSNETGALSRTTMRDDRDHRLQTAGRLIVDMHVRLLDDDGARHHRRPTRPAIPCARGRPRASATSTTPGANEELFTADGWMRIGDLCDDRRRRLPPRRRPHVRHHHPGRQEHQRPRRRGRGARAPRRSRSRPRWRCPTRSSASGCASTPSSSRDRRSTSTASSRSCATGASRPSGSPSGWWWSTRSPGPPGGKVAKGELRADIRRRIADRRGRV